MCGTVTGYDISECQLCARDGTPFIPFSPEYNPVR